MSEPHTPKGDDAELYAADLHASGLTTNHVREIMDNKAPARLAAKPRKESAHSHAENVKAENERGPRGPLGFGC